MTHQLIFEYSLAQEASVIWLTNVHIATEKFTIINIELGTIENIGREVWNIYSVAALYPKQDRIYPIR